MKSLKYIVMILIVTGVIGSVPVLASPYQEQLKASIDQIVSVLKDPKYQGDEAVEERRQALRTLIYERFSFAKMSQLSLGKNWKKRSDKEKKLFIKLFGQLLEETYVSKIEAYTNEEIIYTKEWIKKKKAQVYTKIIGEAIEIPIDYRMYQAKDGQWRVYDMVIEGVSLVGNYRSQFDQILQNDSFETLVEELKKKLDS